MKRLACAVFSLIPCAFAQQFTPLPEGAYTISGTVVNANTGAALPRTRMVVLDTKHPRQTQTIMTNDDGGFIFHVAAGKFSVQAAHRGYITAAYNQHEQFSTAIVTGAGFDTEHLKFKLVPQAMISGIVYNDRGEPQEQAMVSLYRQSRSQGVSRILLRNRAMTDDRGAYELPRLDAGTYFLAVNAEPWYAVYPPTATDDKQPIAVDPALDVAYPTLYYADADDSEEATPIPLRGGDHQTIDFHLSPLPALHIIYRFDPANRQNQAFPQVTRREFNTEDLMRGGAAEMYVPGVIDIRGIPPGTYSVRLPAPDGSMGPAEDVDLEQNGQELIGEGKPNSSELKFKVSVANDPLPSQVYLALEREEGKPSSVIAVDSNGSSASVQLEAGTYTLILLSPNDAFAVEQVKRGDQVFHGHSITVSPGDTGEVTVEAIAGKADVEGQVARAGKSFAGAMVVLIPEDSENHHELFRRDQSDLDGTFRLPGVLPGKYTVIAIEDGWDLDWAKPAVIASYGKHGQKVTVGDKTIHLEHAVEFQAK